MASTGHIKSVTAVTGNMPDGVIVEKAVVGYDFEADPSCISEKTYDAEGRTVVNAHVCEKDGHYVIVELDPKDENAYVRVDKSAGKPRNDPNGPKGQGGPGGPGPDGGRPSGPAGRKPAVEPELRPVQVVITQKEDVAGSDGEVCRACDIKYVSDKAVRPVLDDFRQMKLGKLAFDLFVPKDYDPDRKYPLVIFTHDAGPNGSDPLLTLLQGNGSLIWASPEDQLKHPCFVLCPQIPKTVQLTSDEFTVDPEIETIKKMADIITEQYNIDKDRIYTTGQSQGCMASLELGIRYPDYFGGMILVAGQWDPERCGVLYDHNIWILVSEHDAKAFPGMNAITGVFEEKGALVGHYRWNAKWDKEKLNSEAARAAADGNRVHYTVFDGSTVVPEGMDDTPGTNHVCTWPVAYGIDGVRDWLFEQHR